MDERGYLWVTEYVDRDLDARNWTVFGPDGILLGSLKVPEGFRVLQVGDEEVIGRYKDELGIELDPSSRRSRNSTPLGPLFWGAPLRRRAAPRSPSCR